MRQPTAARGSIIMLIVLVINSVLGYVFNIGLAWLLPARDYGTYGAAVSIMGIILIFVTYGFPWAAAKFLAQEGATEEKEVIFKSVLMGNLIIGLLVIAIFYLVYTFFVPAAEMPAPVIMVMLATIFVFSIRTVYLRTFHGQMKFEEFGIVSIIEAVLRITVGLLLVWLGYSVAGALSGELTSGLIIIIIAAFLLRDMKFWKARGWANPGVFTFAWSMLIGMLGITMLNQMDILIVKFLGTGAIPEQAVGYYQAVRMVAEIPFFLAGSIMSGVFPFISRYAQGDNRTYSLFSLRYIALFSFPFAIFLALLPEPFITFFFPLAYAAAAMALRVLAIGGAFIALIQALAQVFQALGQPGLPAKVLIIAALFQVGLLVPLVPRFGLTGAAAAVAATCLCGAVWLTLKFQTLYKLKIQLGFIARFLLVLLISGLVLYFFPHGSRIWLVLDVIVAGMVYVYLLVALSFIRVVDFDILGQALPQNHAVQAVLKGARAVAVKLGCRS